MVIMIYKEFVINVNKHVKLVHKNAWVVIKHEYIIEY